MKTFDLYEYIKERVFIIAEIGCNFENDLDRAREMICKAAEAGADAVKFQTFIAEKLTTKTAEKFWEIEGCPGETQYEEFSQMPHLTYEHYKMLQKRADSSGILFFSTPEDETSLELLERVDVPFYKVSSMNITHVPLLRAIAGKQKPVILSTGASTIGKIEAAVRVLRSSGCGQLGLLHCISNYPTADEHVNLRMMCHIKTVFPDLPVGYSDHTLPEEGEGILAAAVALGARIIEKHFTFDNSRPGYDHAISADYNGLKRLVTQIRRVEKALGGLAKQPISSELKARTHARRSIVAAGHIAKGTIITKEMLEIKRPGTGIEPTFIDIVAGRTAQIDIPEDTVLQWSMI